MDQIKCTEWNKQKCLKITFWLCSLFFYTVKMQTIIPITCSWFGKIIYRPTCVILRVGFNILCEE